MPRPHSRPISKLLDGPRACGTRPRRIVHLHAPGRRKFLACVAGTPTASVVGWVARGTELVVVDCAQSKTSRPVALISIMHSDRSQTCCRSFREGGGVRRDRQLKNGAPGIQVGPSAEAVPLSGHGPERASSRLIPPDVRPPHCETGRLEARGDPRPRMTSARTRT